MTDEEIVKRWKVGKTKFQVAKDYMDEYNRIAKRRQEPKINKDQALKHVEPIIYAYETQDWK